MSQLSPTGGEGARVERARKLKDAWITEAHDSPLNHEARHGFNGLVYFDYDPAFRVRAVFARFPLPKTVTVGTSTGGEQQYHEYGRFEFELEGRKVGLMGYKKIRDPHAHQHGHESPTLFIPFRDTTSGKESYGAARYIDLPEPQEGPTDLDLNTAYNPYCAYSETYSCPLPPRENWLTVAVRAGECSYSKTG